MRKHTESLASMHPEIRFIEIPEAITSPPSAAGPIEKTGASLSLDLLTQTTPSPVFSNPMPYRVLPLLHSDVDYEAFANHGREFKSSNGIIVKYIFRS
ncbi:hypothetical protein OIU76_021611 [Salix suchowensis]|nr:hypothetical protein OIU76_021611 [Salix suchowensis]